MGPWREIGTFSGLGGYLAAWTYMERQVETYRHPARYRILRADAMASLEYTGGEPVDATAIGELEVVRPPAGDLPLWSPELETELRYVYHSAGPREGEEGAPSRHAGLEAVYAYVRCLIYPWEAPPPPADEDEV
jgi:hypothetical protein